MAKQVKLITRLLRAQHMLISSKRMLLWPCFKLPGASFSLSSHSGWVRSFATKEALSPRHQPILWVCGWDTIPTLWQTCGCVCQAMLGALYGSMVVILTYACFVLLPLSHFSKGKNSKFDILQLWKKCLWDSHKASFCFHTKTLWSSCICLGFPGNLF